MTRIVVIGSLNMDLVAMGPRLPRPGETVLGQRYFSVPGGKGANQAYAAAALGGDVAMLGRVGKDEHGRRLLASLTRAGCDVSGVRAIDDTTGVALILVAESGQNVIVVVPGANAGYRPADLLADEPRLEAAAMVLLQLEIPLDTVVSAARGAKHRGASVVLDPAPAQPALPAELLDQVDVLTPNETEAAELVGRRASELSYDEAQAIAGELRGRGARTVIMKLGAKGCLLLGEEGCARIAAPPVIARDTTAAGDVFNGALAVARAEGASMEEACRFAVRAAALSVTRPGAQESMPTRAELAAFT